MLFRLIIIVSQIYLTHPLTAFFVLFTLFTAAKKVFGFFLSLLAFIGLKNQVK